MYTKISLHTLFLLMSLGLAACGGADSSPPAPKEPASGTGTEANPYLINFGETYTVTIPSSSQMASSGQVWFKGVPPTAGFYVLTMANPSTDLAAQLIAPDAIIPLCDTQFEGVTEVCRSSELDYSFIAGATYYLAVHNFTNVAETGFTITINHE